MTKISDYYKLGKYQSELDFVDIDVEHDTSLFIDPYVFRFRNDDWAIDCNNQIVDYFERVLESIKKKDITTATRLLVQLSEPYETHLGVSKFGIKGRGIGKTQADELFKALFASKAAQTGFLKDLSDCELTIPGISFDKISDITTNIIRNKLIEYTIDQCRLFSIPMEDKPSGRLWDSSMGRWINGVYTDLPCINGKPFLLVPKHVVVYTPAISSSDLYSHEVLDYIQNEHLSLNDSLVEVLKNGKRRVTKKALKKLPEYQYTKEFLFKFCDKHPEILEEYKERKGRAIEKVEDISDIDEAFIAEILIERLRSIPPGDKAASAFHDYCIGALEFIFYPDWVYPKKEVEIHDGRKRIDITYQNGAKEGFFFAMRSTGNLSAQKIIVECKNYSHDLANPELDQISGRFSTLRGKLGFIIARSFSDSERFYRRCKDTAVDGRGVVIPLVDDDLIYMLNLIKDNKRNDIDHYIYSLYDRVTL